MYFYLNVNFNQGPSQLNGICLLDLSSLFHLKLIVSTSSFKDVTQVATAPGHNDGAYVSRQRKDKQILKWDGKAYSFKHRKPVKTDLWKFNVDFNWEIFSMFDMIIGNQKLASRKYIPDPTEQVFFDRVILLTFDSRKNTSSHSYSSYQCLFFFPMMTNRGLLNLLVCPMS